MPALLSNKSSTKPQSEGGSVHFTRVVKSEHVPSDGEGVQRITFTDFDRYMNVIRTVNRVISFGRPRSS